MATQKDAIIRVKVKVDVIGRRTISTALEIENMPAGSVILGPDWNSEVYAYVGDSFWYAPGSDVPWDEQELAQRGPFTVLHEPSPDRDTK